MPTVPDIDAALHRFNSGCEAYDRAMKALRAQDVSQYETESRNAFVEFVGALEWGVKYCLEHFGAGAPSQESIEKLDARTFKKLLQDLRRSARPVLTEPFAEELHAARNRRNALQHDALLAPHADLVKAFTTVRHFLVAYLPVIEERLRSIAPASTAPAAPAAPAAQVETVHAPHRTKGGAAWIELRFREGFTRLREGAARGYSATIASLEAEVEPLLTRQAVRLLEKGLPPTGALGAISEDLEAEVKRLLLRSRDQGIPAAEVERLRSIFSLATRASGLCVEAGWLSVEDGQVRFTEPELAALLVGRQIARSRSADPAPLRTRVASDPYWAEAAWGAVSEGDDSEAWIRPLLEGARPELIPAQVVAACAALGGLPERVIPSPDQVRAFQLCTTALIWFAPIQMPRDGAPQPASTWFLDGGTWRRCVLDLAHASRVFGSALRVDEDSWVRPPEPLGRVVVALASSPRLSAPEARMVAILCAPFQAAARGWMDSDFFTELFHNKQVTEPLNERVFLQAWMGTCGIPALWATGRAEDLDRLAFTSERENVVGYLLNQPALVEDWLRAWKARARTAPDQAARTWGEAVERYLPNPMWPAHAAQALVDECPSILESLGVRQHAFEQLLQALTPGLPGVTTKDAATRAAGDVLRRLELDAPRWRQLIEGWTSRPALPWQVLLEAGAPHDAIARWCVQKLAEREKAPPAYQDGPVGVVSENAEVLSTGPWQLAFQQAPEALEWLMAHGDPNALGVIARACLQSDAKQITVDPKVGRMFGMTVPLSMVLWGRIVMRPQGREAFYAHIEQGGWIGHQHVLEGVFPYGVVTNLWQSLVLDFIGRGTDRGARFIAGTLDPTLDEQAEAARLFACFERWLGTAAAPSNLYGMQLAKTFVMICAATHGVDVSPVLATLLGEFRERRPEPRVPSLVGRVLRDLQRWHPGRAALLLDDALSAPLLAVMCADDTVTFWEVMLRRHGNEKLFTLLDTLESDDLGLGLVEALARLDLDLLRREELRPALLRPLLVYASREKYAPSSGFWEQAWRVERKPGELPELIQLRSGPWLDHLLEWSRSWLPQARHTLLQHLAMYATQAEVRGRCVDALLADPAGS